MAFNEECSSLKNEYFNMYCDYQLKNVFNLSFLFFKEMNCLDQLLTIEVSKKLHRTQEILKYILTFNQFFLHIVMVYDSDNDAFQEMTIVFYVNKCHIVGALNDMALPIFECSL